MNLADGNVQLQDALNSFTSELKSFSALATNLKEEELIIKFGQFISLNSKMIRKLSHVIMEVHNEVDFYADTFAQRDMAESVQNILDTSLQFWEMYKTAKPSGIPEISKSKHSYDTVQIFLNTFLDQSLVEEYRSRLKSAGMNIVPLNKRLEKAIDKSVRRKASVWVGAVSIILVIFILLFKNTIPAQLATALQILFAIGCGGLSAAIIGTIAINLKYSYEISGTGGFAIIILIYFFPPVMPYSRFETWVSLRDSLGVKVLTPKAILSLDLEGPDQPGKYVEDSYFFGNISSDYANRDLEIHIDSSTWVFKKTKTKTINTKLVKGEMKLAIVKDPVLILLEKADSLIMFKAKLVRMGTAVEIEGAKISVLDATEPGATSESDGRFTLKLRKKLHPDKTVHILVEKRGYKPHNKTYDMPLLFDMNIPLVPIAK